MPSLQVNDTYMSTKQKLLSAQAEIDSTTLHQLDTIEFQYKKLQVQLLSLQLALLQTIQGCTDDLHADDAQKAQQLLDGYIKKSNNLYFNNVNPSYFLILLLNKLSQETTDRKVKSKIELTKHICRKQICYLEIELELLQTQIFGILQIDTNKSEQELQQQLSNLQSYADLVFTLSGNDFTIAPFANRQPRVTSTIVRPMDAQLCKLLCEQFLDTSYMPLSYHDNNLLMDNYAQVTNQENAQMHLDSPKNESKGTTEKSRRCVIQ